MFQSVWVNETTVVLEIERVPSDGQDLTTMKVFEMGKEYCCGCFVWPWTTLGISLDVVIYTGVQLVVCRGVKNGTASEVFTQNDER